MHAASSKQPWRTVAFGSCSDVEQNWFTKTFLWRVQLRSIQQNHNKIFDVRFSKLFSWSYIWPNVDSCLCHETSVGTFEQMYLCVQVGYLPLSGTNETLNVTINFWWKGTHLSRSRLSLHRKTCSTLLARTANCNVPTGTDLKVTSKGMEPWRSSHRSSV